MILFIVRALVIAAVLYYPIQWWIGFCDTLIAESKRK